MKRTFVDWGLDFMYASWQYPNGFTRPRVTQGYFENNGTGVLQRLFFDELLGFSFYRTPFQLVFQGQTAGLVRKAGLGIEHHVRFYDDGAIDCEQESSRFGLDHYAGQREHRLDVLEGLLQASVIGRTWGDKIKPLFGRKDYEEKFLRENK